ncbi:MAG: hypothetical protein COB51_06035 [Moraxellaceae bacterium]|nr:MAG: hypothetical protein COB51_06035 [Moraxellaceae bacterium]
MKILWFVVELIATEENVTSSFASTRRRCLEVLRGFGRVGVKADIELIRVNPELKMDAAVFENASLAIVGKMIFDFSSIAAHLSKNNIPILCDGVDLYDDSVVREKAIAWADYLSFSTHSFYRPLPDTGGKPSFTIQDIQEGPVQPISVPGVEVEVIKLMWFGTEAEWESLTVAVKQLKHLHEYSIEILILASAVPADLVASLTEQLPSNIQIEQLAWSFDLYTQRLNTIDFVMLSYAPSEAVGEMMGDPIVSALWQGKMVLACLAWKGHPLQDFIGTTDDIADGLRALMTRLNSVATLIDKGQLYIEQWHSLKAGTLKWIEVIEEVTQLSLLGENGVEATVEGAPEEAFGAAGAVGNSAGNSAENSAVEAPQNTGVKLKMGAMNRHTNAESRSEYVYIGDENSDGADVVCDLKTLSKFQTDTADEILSVDNIDQFYQWEVGDVLKSWARVLKPGGALVIECADFSIACEQFLKESVAGGTANTLKQIYGDPAQRNPNAHPKWGYTTDSLKRLMLACGLEEVELQTLPDISQVASANRIRMVGIKPQV